MYPALITAAFFTGVFLNDLIQKQPPMELTKHLFFGVLCVFALWALEFGGKTGIAWGLLIVPTLVLGIGITYFLVNPVPKPVVLKPVPKPEPAPEPSVEEDTVIQNPDALYACVEHDFTKGEDESDMYPSCDVGADGTIGMPGTFPQPKPEPAFPTPTDTLFATLGKPSPAQTTPSPKTLDTLLKDINKSITPVTVCPKA